MRRGWSLLLVGLACAPAGCITVYQPMSGLHRPVAIDTRVANFADVALTVRCVPGDDLEAGDAKALCRKLSRLFENQGAVVETQTTRAAPLEEKEAPAADPKRLALVVELRARTVHQQVAAPFWWDPASDYTFAQDVAIRDETGFLLVRDTLTGRFVRRLGWSSDSEEAFSRDFYRQLSQLAFNARMLRRVSAAPASVGE